MKNYSIALCDDTINDLLLIGQQVAEILNRNNIEYNLSEFSSPEDLCKSIKKMPNKFDLIILDVLMPEINGIKLGSFLRENGVKSSIIFATNSSDFALKGYEVNAFRYILKPVAVTILEEAILSDYRNRSISKDLIFRIGTEVRKVPYNSIYFIETKGRGIRIHLIKEVFDVPLKISELDKVLQNSSLVRCHRSYIVNLKHINQIKIYMISVNKKNQIPVSRQYYDSIKK